jgi:hypothetical protein
LTTVANLAPPLSSRRNTKNPPHFPSNSIIEGVGDSLQ